MIDLVWQNLLIRQTSETSSFINRLTDPVQAMAGAPGFYFHGFLKKLLIRTAKVSTYYGHTIAVNAEMKQESPESHGFGASTMNRMNTEANDEKETKVVQIQS